jgi:hypothetical protein
MPEQFCLFLHPFNEINPMTLGKRFLRFFFLILIFSLLGSCASSRKVKKKCLDCPEFSQAEASFQPVIYPHEKL